MEDSDDYNYDNQFQGMYDEVFNGFDDIDDLPMDYFTQDAYGDSEGTFNSWHTFKIMFPQCFYPTSQQILYTVVFRLLGTALLIRLASILRTPAIGIHLLSAGLGFLLVWLQFDVAGLQLFAVFEALGYCVYRFTPSRRGVMMSLFVLLFLFFW